MLVVQAAAEGMVLLTAAGERSMEQVLPDAFGPENLRLPAAEVLARARGGATEVDVPLAGLRGTERTLWLLDREAAGRL